MRLPAPIPGQFGIGYGVRLHKFVTVACIEALIYALAVAGLLRGRVPPLWFVLLVAGLLRAIVLTAPPFLSNDIFRYFWDGEVQAAGINPYRYIPDDPHLAFLRDRVVFPNINRASYAPTIYPPSAEMIFFLASRIAVWFGLPPILTMRLTMVALEAVAIWAILRLLALAGMPRARVLIYAWNPLPVWEFAGNGHVDAISVCFVALAMLAACEARRGLSAAALAFAVLAKFLPIVLAPALWRRWDWRFAGVFLGLIALLYTPYLGAGRHVFGFLGGYAAQEGIYSGQGIYALSLLGLIVPLPGIAAALYVAALAVLLLGLGLVAVFQTQTRDAPARARHVACWSGVLSAALMAGLSPHFPWYYAWLLVPACILPWPSTIYLASAAFLLYRNPIHSQLYWPSFLYLPFAVLAAFDIWRARAERTTS